MSALGDAIRRLYETDPDFEVYAYLADEVEKVETENSNLREDLEALARRHALAEAKVAQLADERVLRETGVDPAILRGLTA